MFRALLVHEKNAIMNECRWRAEINELRPRYYEMRDIYDNDWDNVIIIMTITITLRLKLHIQFRN